MLAYRATRPKVERKIGHLTRRVHGGRKARCRGVARVLTDFITRCRCVQPCTPRHPRGASRRHPMGRPNLISAQMNPKRHSQARHKPNTITPINVEQHSEEHESRPTQSLPQHVDLNPDNNPPRNHLLQRPPRWVLGQRYPSGGQVCGRHKRQVPLAQGSVP